MIVAYTGRPGSGKSMHITSLVLRRLRQDPPTPVVTNVQIERSCVAAPRHLHVVTPAEVGPAELTRAAAEWWARQPSCPAWRREGRLLYVLDEAHAYLGSRTWQGAERQAWLAWMTQHRHQGWDVILASQHMDMIDAQIRGLVDLEVRHIRLDKWMRLPLPLILTVTIDPWMRGHREWGLVLPTRRVRRAYDSWDGMRGVSDG